MENYAAKARLPARETIVFHHLLFPHARSRFLCKRTAATRRAWSKSNQLNFEFPVTLAAFFHSPFRLSSSYFPFHHRQPAFNALKMRFENFFPYFFQKSSTRFEIPDRGGGENYSLERSRKKKKSEARTTNFKYYSYLLNCYCYEKHIFLFFFFFRIRGETIRRYSRLRELVFATARRTFRGIGP